jgi:hypothetical protein
MSWTVLMSGTPGGSGLGWGGHVCWVGVCNGGVHFIHPGVRNVLLLRAAYSNATAQLSWSEVNVDRWHQEVEQSSQMNKVQIKKFGSGYVRANSLKCLLLLPDRFHTAPVNRGREGRTGMLLFV